MKKFSVLFIAALIIIAILLITACQGGAGGAIFDGPSGDWNVTANIDLGGGTWTGTSNGETNVDISEDLEDITGTATMVVPPVSPRAFKELSRIALNSRITILMKKFFPALNPARLPENGNTITANEESGNMILEFTIHFNGLDMVTGTVDFLIDGSLTDQYTANITRNRDEENPDRVEFEVEIPDMDYSYTITCTR